MKSKKKSVILPILFIATGLFLSYIFIISGTSKEVAIFSNTTSNISLDIPKNCTIETNSSDLSVEKKSNSSSYSTGSVKLYSSTKGKFNLRTKLYGIIPISNVNVSVLPDEKLIPSGNLIGVSLNTKGAIAVKFEDIIDENGEEISPAKDGGLKLGDIIKKINGISVNNAQDVITELNLVGEKEVKIQVNRDYKLKTLIIKPVKAKQDGKYKMGLWVRDSIAGIGTITCYNEDKTRFVALGHSITDVDTGVIMPVKSGNIIESELISIVKGKVNAPGELRGVLKTDKKDIIGNITLNNNYGIYGNVTKNIYDNKTAYKIALQDEIKEGKAYIITTIDNKGPRKFSVEITKTYKQNSRDTKSMLIKVTDGELLEKTGGIVQGMSGSPIIQNGKLVGAVTHVFVNNPKMGYGIYIQWLLQDLINNQK